MPTLHLAPTPYDADGFIAFMAVMIIGLLITRRENRHGDR